MAKDAEFERLKTTHDLAFQRMKDAHQDQDRAWQRRSNARDALNRAYQDKQQAYEAQDAAWQEYQRVRANNGPRIDWLNSQQETAYQNMLSAFQSASDAYNAHDGASASYHASEGHGYKAESQGYVTERRQLVEEIRNAKAWHENTKPAFQQAKSQFDHAKQDHAGAKAEHEKKQEAYKRAREEFDRARSAFQARLEKVKAENKRKREGRRSLAQKAGVPSQYLDDIWVSTKPDGTVNIYFGGAGKPNGPGHGHYTMDRYGKVTYRREPFDPHGRQNFERDSRLESRLAEMAVQAFEDYRATGPRRVQYDDGTIAVKVKSGYHADTKEVVTDVIVTDRVNSPNEHLHIGFSAHDGTILFSEWRRNH